MIVSTQGRLPTLGNIVQIENQELKCVKKYNYLGLITDSELCCVTEA